MKKTIPILAIVIPCYNEQLLIKSTIIKLLEVINYLIQKNKINSNSFLYLVDDGSTDNTWNIIEQSYKENNKVKGLKFIRNEGMQIALRAGYEKALDLGCDCVVSIDADLEQDESAIEQFIDKYIIEGADIVFGIRNSRNTDNLIKKTTANIYYKLMKLLKVNILQNHADYRLMSKLALQELIQQKEKNIMLRFFFNSLNLKKSYVHFNTQQNTIRKSHFNFSKMFNLAFNGLTSSTFAPLQIVYYIGISIVIITVLLILLYIYLHLNNQSELIPIIILLLFCINFFCISIICIYIKKIIIELKTDKRYIIDKELS